MYTLYQQDIAITKPMTKWEAEAKLKKLESCLTNLWIDDEEAIECDRQLKLKS